MRSYLRWAFAGIILGLLVGVPWAYAAWRNVRYRNFHVVREGVLYRSGQLSLDGLHRIIHDHAIKTVVTLRFSPDNRTPPPDFDEEQFCKKIHMHYFRLKHLAWNSPDRSVPAEANIEQFMKIMSNPDNHPVLVHCFAGVHRTGAFCALYRMEFEKWSCDEAMREMRAFGYAQDHQDVFGFLARYQPRGYQMGHVEPVSLMESAERPRLRGANSLPMPAASPSEETNEATVESATPSAEPPLILPPPAVK